MSEPGRLRRFATRCILLKFLFRRFSTTLFEHWDERMLTFITFR